MKLTKSLLLCIFAVLGLLPMFANAQTLKADYQFQGNLNSSVAGAPAMTNLNCAAGANSFVPDTVDGYARQSLRFPINCGLAVSTAGGLIPGGAYTIVILFKFDETSGSRRVIDFKNGVSDAGAYTQDGRLEFESTANPPFFPSTYIQVVVVRETSGAVRAYRDGGFRVNVPNDGGSFQIDANNILRFFQDDSQFGGEASAGNVARIRLYDAPMTTTQVRLLERVPNVGGGEQPILFYSGRDGFAEIYSMNADGSNQRRLTFHEFADYEGKWSPDGRKIVYTRRETNTAVEQIWVMNADGSSPTRLTNTTTNDHAPVWKPDGTKILFSRCDANFVCDLYTMNPDGSNQAPIPNVNTPDDEDRADYSPNGQQIVFSRFPIAGGAVNIFKVNSDGSGQQQLTTSPAPTVNANAIWSPDGNRIAFYRAANPQTVLTYEVIVMDSNGNNQTNLTNNNVFDGNPIWSPDGTRLAFSSERESIFTELYTMNSANGTSISRLITNSIGETVSDWRRLTPRRAQFDFDGDGRADVSVFRPSNGTWYLQRSTAGFAAVQFGFGTDILTPADYDGDGKTDVAVFRNGNWYRLNSSDNQFVATFFGQAGDVPVPADYDGDGQADIAVFRGGNWYYLQSSNGQFRATLFGFGTDKPVPADYEGDSKADIAVFRDGNWYRLNSSNGQFVSINFGFGNDKTVPADYDGDSKADIAVFRDGNWYRLNSSNGQFAAVLFGQAGDVPVAADYDGDGRADQAVFRQGNWYILQSSNGQFRAEFFGLGTDTAIPNIYVR